jgi:hypothetical protein
LAKSRGRYLIILPGGLVPRVPDADQRERLVRAQKADGASYTGAGTDISAAKEANPKKEEEGNGDDDIEIIDGVDVTPKPPADTTTPAPPPSSKPAPFTPTTAPTVLGQLQKLGTADPVLVYLKISRCK